MEYYVCPWTSVKVWRDNNNCYPPENFITTIFVLFIIVFLLDRIMISSIFKGIKSRTALVVSVNNTLTRNIAIHFERNAIRTFGFRTCIKGDRRVMCPGGRRYNIMPSESAFIVQGTERRVVVLRRAKKNIILLFSLVDGKRKPR